MTLHRPTFKPPQQAGNAINQILKPIDYHRKPQSLTKDLPYTTTRLPAMAKMTDQHNTFLGSNAPTRIKFNRDI